MRSMVWDVMSEAGMVCMLVWLPLVGFDLGFKVEQL